MPTPLDLNLAFPIGGASSATNERNAEFQARNLMEVYQQNVQRQDPLGPLKRQEMQNRIDEGALQIQGQQLSNEARQFAMKETLQQRAEGLAGINLLSQYARSADEPQSMARLVESLSDAGISLPVQENILKQAEAINKSAANVEATRALARQREAMADWRESQADSALLGGGETVPYVKEVGGKLFLINPRSGAAHEVKQERLPPEKRLELSSLYRQLEGAQKALRAEPPAKVGEPVSDTRTALLKEQRRLRERIEELNKEAETAAPSAPATSPTPATPTPTPGTTPTTPGVRFQFDQSGRLIAPNSPLR